MSTLKRLSVLLVMGFSAFTQAAVLSNQKSYYPADFYTQVDHGLRDAALKDQLFAILSKGHITGGSHDQLKDSCGASEAGCAQHFSLGYTRAREVMFGEIHLHNTSSGYEILDVYCQEHLTAKDFPKHPPGPNQIPDAAVINAEHTWPQSFFSKKFDTDLQKSDLNILYPVNSKSNSSRSNLHYANVTAVLTQPCASSKRGLSADGTKEEFFEPPAVHKGNAARAIFYFSIRYKSPIGAEEEATLREWNRQDPPDDFERQRNEIVYNRQMDRNPFIDHPELVDLISDF
ncbi:MAG: endonuclease [Bdellovibrionales bacterium]